MSLTQRAEELVSEYKARRATEAAEGALTPEQDDRLWELNHTGDILLGEEGRKERERLRDLQYQYRLKLHCASVPVREFHEKFGRKPGDSVAAGATEMFGSHNDTYDHGGIMHHFRPSIKDSV